MREFEPKLKQKIFTREFFSKYIYIFVVGLFLLLGVSYSLTFFVQNKNVATGSITTGDLTITFTDRSINVDGLLPPINDAEGLLLYAKQVTITNTTSIDGRVKLTLTRTSGLNLTDLRYALIVNGAIQTIDDMPSNGEIMTTAIMSNEEINVEIRLWPKSNYSNGESAFVGELTPEIRYFGSKASNLSNPTGKYVNFNCSGNTCEVWQIVKVQDGRLVLTRQADYSGATERAWTGKYYSGLVFNDDSLISSVSDDNDHKNVYLLRTVKIDDGTGTQQDPYTLTNNVLSEPDKKAISKITYKDGTTTVGTQNVYYNETNYISQVMNDPNFIGWTDNTNDYELGDTIAFTSDTILTEKIAVMYTVTYRWGHLVLNTQQVPQGTTITLPTTDYTSNIESHLVIDNSFYSLIGVEVMKYDIQDYSSALNIDPGSSSINSGDYFNWFVDSDLTEIANTSQTINSDTTFYYAGLLQDSTDAIYNSVESDTHNVLLFKDSDLQSLGLTYVSDYGAVDSTNDTFNNIISHGTINGISGYYFDIGHLTSDVFGFYQVGHIYVNFLDSNNSSVTHKYLLASDWQPCLLAGTEVTIEVEEEDENGKKKKKRKKKKIEDITYDDILVVWDFDNGCYATAKPLWIMEQKETDEYYNIKFEDGSELNAVTAHRIFNLDLNKFTYLNDEKLTPIGTRVYKEDGTVTRIVERKKVWKVAKYHNIVTEYHLNLFANGILTSCRLNNMYDIKDMKFIKDNRVLREREEFEGIDDKYIDGFRLLEQPRDDINRLNAVYHGATLKEYVITNFLNHKKR